MVEAISTKFERGIDVRHLSLFFAKRITEVIYKSVDAGCHMSARWEHEGQACKRSDRLFEKCDYLPAHNFRLTQPLLRQPNSKTIQNQISYVERQPSWPVPTTTLAGGAGRKTGLPVWRAAPPA